VQILTNKNTMKDGTRWDRAGEMGSVFQVTYSEEIYR